MAEFIRPLITWLTLVLVAAVPAARAETAPKVNIHFAVFSSTLPTELTYVAADRQAPTALTFYRSQRSKDYAYVGRRTLRFYAGQDLATPVAAYEVPEESKKLLLLFQPQPKQPGQTATHYEIIGVDDSVERVPLGHFTFLNVSGRDYEARYGRQKFTVPAGGSEAYPGGAEKYLKLIATLSGHPVPVGGLMFGLTSELRATIVVFPPAHKTGVQPLIRVLYDESGQNLKR